MRTTPLDPVTDAELLDEALDALLMRVHWYRARRFAVPEITARSFNRLADALGKPDRAQWSRL